MTTKPNNGITVKKFHPMRRTIVDFVELATKKHTVYALGEADVTIPRRQLQAHYKKTGEKISFTSFIITSYAHLIQEKYTYPLNTYRKGKKKLLVFNEVDVACIIEREIGDRKIPTSYTVRDAGNKTLREIHDEIRKAQQGRKDRMTTGQKDKGIANKLHLLPSFIRKKLFDYVLKNPKKKKKINGTVGVTAVGMYSGGSGYMINMTPHTTSCGVGGIDTYPRYVNGKLEPREMLNVTLSFDHDVVDGGIAARFSADIREWLADKCLEETWSIKSL